MNTRPKHAGRFLKNAYFCIQNTIEGMDAAAKQKVINMLDRHIGGLFGDSRLSEAVREGVDRLLGAGAFGMTVDMADSSVAMTEEADIHEVLARLNEKESRRRRDGVYYTHREVSDYITANAIVRHFAAGRPDRLYSYAEAVGLMRLSPGEVRRRLMDVSVFDPTCGTGEFLVSALRFKADVAAVCGLDEDMAIAIGSSICGNDIESESVVITKVRVFMELVPCFVSGDGLLRLADAINGNFHTIDFVRNSGQLGRTFDIAVGNPPYVEYRALDYVPEPSFGNLYANVLHNVSEMLTPRGTIGFIVPLSLVSTPRMAKIRKYISGKFDRVAYLSYADRPDCLFAGVHQKLAIVLAANAGGDKETYTSSYRYWYRSERRELFGGSDVIVNNSVQDGYIPKLGNVAEQSIFDKVMANRGRRPSRVRLYPSDDADIFLGMRGCFWIKAFRRFPGSREYKGFGVAPGAAPYVLCVLNSSLFFLFWVIVSDGWHITNKELETFYIPEPEDYSVFEPLWQRLEDELERTKVYVGTRQTEYEYKHRMCKHIIDKIDEALAPIYGLTHDELAYIKGYILKYRCSDGA